ncbi:MAG TPA: M1 family metallopeptidase [Candidatus Saccharimonas sp.]|nr:M1 family metallopeptidase [Candidatus Saccharimonas sp.]
MNTVRQLTQLFKPASYKLKLDLTKRVARTFSGTAELHGELLKDASEIVLHSKDLVIIAATVNGQKATVKQGEDDELAIATGEMLSGKQTILLDFTGTITDPMHGLYPCYFKHDGKDKELLATQLESHYAREVFPCIDEPAGKATFNVTLVTEPDITVLGNTPVAKSHPKDGALVTHFETTPNMSPYLLAFVAGELEYTEVTNKNGVLIRSYAVPGKKDQTPFSLEWAAKTLEFYDDYFALPYPLPKLDLVALPDFSSGAMENWGLVTFRESCMLIDDANSPPEMREYVATVVTHELAHQWFGNLVTMQWWNDLWLNESFAKWMENYSADKLEPKWQLWEQFGAQEQQYAFIRDSLANVQAVREPVHHPEELNSLFDPAIVYAKGACLLRMLQNYLGETVFRDGLRAYMKHHKYGNASADDLWVALSDVSGKDVKTFMHQWLTQPGHPVVTANLDGNSLALTQRRFYANPKQAEDTGVTWPLPLLSNQLNAELFDTAANTYAVTDKPVVLNKNHTGFYHTLYDAGMLEAIAALIDAGKLSTVDRQGLLVDNNLLSRAGLQSSADVLRLLAHYKDESSYPVWQAMNAVTGAVRTLINDDPAIKPLMQKYVAKLAQPQFERLGWERTKGESYFDELLRPSIIALLAYAEVPAVVDRALQIFDAAKQPEDITQPELRGIAYSVAVRDRGESAFSKVLDWYKTTDSADERTTLAAGLSALRDAKIAHKATDLFTTKTIKPQDLGFWFAYFMRNRHSRATTWQWMQDNWGWIETQFKNSHDYGDFPKYSAGAFSTNEDLAKYKAFFEPKLGESDIAMVIRQGIEEIEVRALWRERDLAAITDFLRKI